LLCASRALKKFGLDEKFNDEEKSSGEERHVRSKENDWSERGLSEALVAKLAR
jgi:hypothetical protein